MDVTRELFTFVWIILIFYLFIFCQHKWEIVSEEMTVNKTWFV